MRLAEELEQLGLDALAKIRPHEELDPIASGENAGFVDTRAFGERADKRVRVVAGHGKALPHLDRCGLVAQT